MSRPRKEFDPEQFEKLCELQCTEVEIASVLGMGVTVLVENCRRHYGVSFREVRSLYKEVGKVRIRCCQFKLAERSPKMAIWLGMQYLGQSSKRQAEIKQDLNSHQDLSPPTIVIKLCQVTAAGVSK